MEFSTETGDRASDIAALFAATFSDSEGPDEGRLIGALATKLMATTAAQDIRVVTAWIGDDIAGAIMFTRLDYAEDPRRVVLLAPVAVATSRQKSGVGQALLRHGLDLMRAEGKDVAITYGDPRYYGKVGFEPITEDMARAPLTLSFPHGWQALSMTNAPLTPLAGASRCVPAFDDPALW